MRFARLLNCFSFVIRTIYKWTWLWNIAYNKIIIDHERIFVKAKLNTDYFLHNYSCVSQQHARLAISHSLVNTTATSFVYTLCIALWIIRLYINVNVSAISQAWILCYLHLILNEKSNNVIYKFWNTVEITGRTTNVWALSCSESLINDLSVAMRMLHGESQILCSASCHAWCTCSTGFVHSIRCVFSTQA